METTEEERWMAQFSPQELLELVLRGMDIVIVRTEAGRVWVEQDFCIEVEGASLYKLMQGGLVVAPFADVVELGEFIKRH